MKTISTLIFLFLSCATFFGQSSTKSNINLPFIEVTGIAEKEVIPDEIYIALTLRERPSGKDKVTVEEQEAELKIALESIGVPLENLYLSDANADYVNVNWAKKEVISETQYLLKVSSAATVGRVFEQLDKLKINDAYISKVSHSKIKEFRKEVRIMAIIAAKEKSDYLLAAIGQETGKALKVLETSHGFREDQFANIRSKELEVIRFELSQNSSEKKNETIQFQKIKLQASIFAKFEIR